MKKILTVLSEYGYWGEELVGPMETLEKAGYTIVFATPRGNRPHALPPSMDSDYIDPPLNKTVVSKEMERLVQELDSSQKLDNPINISAWIPERPYMSSNNYLRELEAYYEGLEKIQEEISGYDALLLVGGSGPIVDIANNQRVHDLILGVYKMDKPIAAEC